MGEGREPNAFLAGRVYEHPLLAAGFRVFRTMPRFGDARGGYCMIGRCPDCMVVVDGVPNIPACVTPLSTGLAVRIQHGLGDADWTGSGEPAE